MIRTIKNLYHLAFAALNTARYGNPSREIKVIGVTGTDGKTTTTSLIYHILKYCGKKASMVSTVYAKVGDKEYDTGFHVSTPHSSTVQRFLRESVQNGDEYFVMETTSHALDQNRVYGVEYFLGIITNITHEHLDYHKTYDHYVKSKTKMLQKAKTRIINADDASYEPIRKILNGPAITYGLEKGDVSFDISKKLNMELATFNKYNYLAAYIACKECGIPEEQIFAAMKTFTLPSGRMEIIQEKPFLVIVDFAHTPYSIKAALGTIESQYGHTGRIIHVFGCAAKRDLLKRPIMGEESGKIADLVIITEEDYRDENPFSIASEIAEGLFKVGFKDVPPEEFGNTNKTYTVITDRSKAVQKAILIAEPGDIVVFTGKGHEKSLARGNKEVAWDEQQAVRDALAHKK